MSVSKHSPAKPSGQIPLFEPDPKPNFVNKAFQLSPANEEIVDTVHAWLDSTEAFLVICGAPGSGKSHLGSLLVERSGVERQACFYGMAGVQSIKKTLLSMKDSAEDCAPDGLNLVVVDPITVPENDEAAQALMDMIETCREMDIRLVLIGRGIPQSWAGDLKDLHTRLEAMVRIEMPEPDEALMRLVIGYHLTDRQLALTEEDILTLSEFAAIHLPRTFAAAQGFAKALDVMALSEKKKPSKSMAKLVIEQM